MKTSKKYYVAGMAAATISLGAFANYNYRVFGPMDDIKEEVRSAYEKRELSLSALEDCLAGSQMKCSSVFSDYRSANQEYDAVKVKYSVSSPVPQKIDWLLFAMIPFIFGGAVSTFFGLHKANDAEVREAYEEHLQREGSKEE